MANHCPILMTFCEKYYTDIRQPTAGLFSKLAYLVLLHYLAKQANVELASFSLKCYRYCLSDSSLSLLEVCDLVDSQLMLHHPLNIIVNGNHRHHHYHVACPVMDVAVPTSVLQT